jgi:hypothetical protein
LDRGPDWQILARHDISGHKRLGREHKLHNRSQPVWTSGPPEAFRPSGIGRSSSFRCPRSESSGSFGRSGDRAGHSGREPHAACHLRSLAEHRPTTSVNALDTLTLRAGIALMPTLSGSRRGSQMGTYSSPPPGGQSGHIISCITSLKILKSIGGRKHPPPAGFLGCGNFGGSGGFGAGGPTIGIGSGNVRGSSVPGSSATNFMIQASSSDQKPGARPEGSRQDMGLPV